MSLQEDLLAETQHLQDRAEEAKALEDELGAMQDGYGALLRRNAELAARIAELETGIVRQGCALGMAGDYESFTAWLGAPVEVERIYYQAQPVEEWTRLAQSIGAGRSGIVSAKGRSTWAAIAGGAEDAYWRSVGKGLAALPADRVTFCFHHEPEGDGSPAAFVAAAGRVFGLVAEGGFKGLRAICLMAVTFARGEAERYLAPGTDLIGVDGYNWAGCRAKLGYADPSKPWRSFAEIMEPARRFAEAHELPWAVFETSCAYDEADPLHRARWITEAGSFAKISKLQTLAWFEHEIGDGSPSVCQWAIRKDPAALAAFRGLVDDPYFGGGGHLSALQEEESPAR